MASSSPSMKAFTFLFLRFGAILEYDNDNEDDENAEVESYDSELNEIIPDDDLDDVELSEEDDDDDYEDETND